MTNYTFKEKVYALTKKIPKGKVATYGELAKLAGHPKAARVVGVFMKNNQLAPVVPCHRVVASDGALTGYSGASGVAGKEKMLKEEGVIFQKNGKVDLRKSKWQR